MPTPITDYFVTVTNNKTITVDLLYAFSYYAYQAYVNNSLIKESTDEPFSFAASTNDKIDILGITRAESGFDFSQPIIACSGNVANDILASMIDGVGDKTPGNDSQCIYSADHQDDNTGPSWDAAPPYTRNPNRIFPDIDLTGVFGKVLGQAGNTYCGSICVGDHTIIAAHHATPSTYNAVEADGTMTTLTVASQLRVGATDIEVIKTNETIPAGIKRFKLLPGNWKQKLGSQSPLVLYVRRDQRLYIGTLVNSEQINIEDASGFTGWSWNQALIGGDSGCPNGVIIDSEFIPLYLNFGNGPSFSSSGPNLADNATAIQTAMNTLNTGDTLQFISLDIYSNSGLMNQCDGDKLAIELPNDFEGKVNIYSDKGIGIIDYGTLLASVVMSDNQDFGWSDEPYGRFDWGEDPAPTSSKIYVTKRQKNGAIKFAIVPVETSIAGTAVQLDATFVHSPDEIKVEERSYDPVNDILTLEVLPST